MITEPMKLVSILVLALAPWGRSSPNYLLLLEFTVCMGAVLVVAQAFGLRRPLWSAAFCLIALLYNPLYPLALSPWSAVSADVTALVAFFAALQLNLRPKGTITSIRARAA